MHMDYSSHVLTISTCCTRAPPVLNIFRTNCFEQMPFVLRAYDDRDLRSLTLSQSGGPAPKSRDLPPLLNPATRLPCRSTIRHRMGVWARCMPTILPHQGERRSWLARLSTGHLGVTSPQIRRIEATRAMNLERNSCSLDRRSRWTGVQWGNTRLRPRNRYQRNKRLRVGPSVSIRIAPRASIASPACANQIKSFSSTLVNSDPRVLEKLSPQEAHRHSV